MDEKGMSEKDNFGAHDTPLDGLHAHVQYIPK
jgi:hypothetical protein